MITTRSVGPNIDIPCLLCNLFISIKLFNYKNCLITRNRNPKREPQNNHIKETLIIIMSTTSERSL